jgi:hypothetical protein
MSEVKIDEDAGVLAHARHGTTAKWSSPSNMLMEWMGVGWYAEQSTDKRMKVQESAKE